MRAPKAPCAKMSLPFSLSCSNGKTTSETMLAVQRTRYDPSHPTRCQRLSTGYYWCCYITIRFHCHLTWCICDLFGYGRILCLHLHCRGPCTSRAVTHSRLCYPQPYKAPGLKQPRSKSRSHLIRIVSTERLSLL